MTEEKKDITICPHCKEKMKNWQTSELTTWGGEEMLVCFNDECTYYVRGWDHMFKTRAAKCSYRHQVNPRTGASSPLPVNTPNAGKDYIIED